MVRVKNNVCIVSLQKYFITKGLSFTLILNQVQSTCACYTNKSLNFVTDYTVFDKKYLICLYVIRNNERIRYAEEVLTRILEIFNFRR